MYEKFYQLSAKPFQLNPDPKFFFRSKGHLRAMAYLRYGLQQGQGFVVVTGDVGTGKTMLVNNLFKELAGQNVVAAKVVSTNVREHDLLRLVAADLGMQYDKASKGVLLANLERHFRACVDDGKRVLIVIDEAQNLPRPSLEELRMLSNFDYNGQPLVQSFLLGQREFRQVLRAQGLEQVRQRIIAAYHLKPLTVDEVRDYILHRLKKVGWKDDPAFEAGVFEAIHAFTHGVPRRINTLMDRLLLHGALESLHALGPAALATVTGELRVEQGTDPADSSQEISQLPGDDIRLEDPGAATRRPSAPAGPDIQNLEARLAQMAQAVDRLVTLQTAPVRHAPPLPAPEPESEHGISRWAWALGAAGTVLVIFIGLLVYVLATRGS